MNLRIYNFLVNKHPGIRERYHKMHDGSQGARKILSWLYLLWMNICYYVFFCRFLDRPFDAPIYEEKTLPTKQSESASAQEIIGPADRFLARLSNYDIISFDIFDTLIFRPFSEPADLFYFLQERLGLLDLKRIRTEQELFARWEAYKETSGYEVTLSGIWNRIEKEVGIPAEEGMRIEQELELSFCYANPFMSEIYHRLLAQGKTIILTSDMYLSSEFLSRLLQKNGYTGFSRLYVSCEHGVNKGTGKLFEVVREELPPGKSFIHVGDNETSDVEMPKKAGFDSMWYPNVNRMALSYRPYDMSPLIGGAYRGIVDNHLYQGVNTYSMEYEYGFIYGGLFVLGYCRYIHEYCTTHQVDKLLFLARDGDILKQVYDRLYPDEATSYVYWSRAAATKLMAEYNRYDYIRRYIYHKVNQKKTLKSILQSMELDHLTERLKTYADRDDTHDKTGILLSEETFLTDKNADAMKRFVFLHFDEVLEHYHEQNIAAKSYYTRELEGCSHALAVDIGWAGSGAISLAYLVEQVWNIPCRITGMLAGTNTVHNVEPDASESFLQSGKLVSYLYSASQNLDLMKKHDLNKDYNVFWELLLSSPTRQFLGFGLEKNDSSNHEIIKLHFGELDANQKGICEIQRGILDFVEEYRMHFHDYSFMFHISGRDAYAPMLVAASYNEKYLNAIKDKFALEIGVN